MICGMCVCVCVEGMCVVQAILTATWDPTLWVVNGVVLIHQSVPGTWLMLRSELLAAAGFLKRAALPYTGAGVCARPRAHTKDGTFLSAEIKLASLLPAHSRCLFVVFVFSTVVMRFASFSFNWITCHLALQCKLQSERDLSVMWGFQFLLYNPIRPAEPPHTETLPPLTRKRPEVQGVPLAKPDIPHLFTLLGVQLWT